MAQPGVGGPMGPCHGSMAARRLWKGLENSLVERGRCEKWLFITLGDSKYN